MAKLNDGLRPLTQQQTGPAVWKIVIGLVVAAVLFGIVVNLGSSGPKSTRAASVYTPPPPPVVVYELDGSASSADITIQTPTGTSQQQGVDVPMMNKAGDTGLKFAGFSSGDFVYISAQNTEDYGDVTCRIKVNGKTISENTASGAYAIASCSGSV